MKTLEQTNEYYRNYYALNREKIRLKSREAKRWRIKDTEKYLYVKAKNRAIRDGLEFSIEIDDIIIPEYCPYLGLKLGRVYNNDNREINPSIDRIDNSKGYVKGNIQVISFKANKMKTDATNEQLVTFAQNILRMNGEL